MAGVSDRDPNDVAGYDALAERMIGGPRPLTAPIEIREYDPVWPAVYAREAERIRGALGNRVVRLEHVGSTSVPGLAAKPIIDIALEVVDTTNEIAYVPELEASGYVLRMREPDWFEHRLFKRDDPAVNLHTFSADCAETDRMLLFRDQYLRTKRALAARDWKYTQQYADAKTDVIEQILARANTTPR
jgi:GrpB-like predicted nucleotidyltransferase (UPF0157 family)